MDIGNSNTPGWDQHEFTCTQMRQANILQKAPPCCPYCHEHPEQEPSEQHYMRHEHTPAGHLLILCCQIDQYLRPINSELDNELKIIEGHIGA